MSDHLLKKTKEAASLLVAVKGVAQEQNVLPNAELLNPLSANG